MKFSVGEIVVYVGPSDCVDGSSMPVAKGDEVLITHAFMLGESQAYVLDHPELVIVAERDLRKRPYKDQHTPAEQSFGELISSLKGVGV